MLQNNQEDILGPLPAGRRLQDILLLRRELLRIRRARLSILFACILIVATSAMLWDFRSGTFLQLTLWAAVDLGIVAFVVIEIGVTGRLFSSLQRKFLFAKRRWERSETHNQFLIKALSHDIKGELAALMRKTESWAAQPPARPALEAPSARTGGELAAGIKDAHHAITRIIDNFNLFSLLWTGSLAKLPLEPFDLDAVMNSLRSRVVPPDIAGERIVWEGLGQGPLTVVGNQDALAFHILPNLLSNAQKFSPADSIVRVGITALPGERAALISIRDGGPGLRLNPHLSMVKLRTPGRRESFPLKRSGIGLQIVVRLCELSGVIVQFRSRHLTPEDQGSGTAVILSIPLSMPAV